MTLISAVQSRSASRPAGLSRSAALEWPWAYWMYRYDDFSAHARNFEQLKNKIAWRVALPPKPVALRISLSGSNPKSESP